MNLKLSLAIVFLTSAPFLHAAPRFWNIENATPTPPAPPPVQPIEDPADLTATPTPATAPSVERPTATPTPLPGLSPKNPTQAALFSVVVPGSGHVYAGDPLKGLLFATLFGVGLWQTIDNFQLVPDRPGSGNLIAKNETVGNLFGLATLAAYGFGIQDAFNTATHFNKRNHLTLHLGTVPRPGASLAYLF